MRQVTFSKFFIFSVFTKNACVEVNQLNTRVVKRVLKDEGIKFSMCEGVYKGTDELSFMVFDGPEVEATVKALCTTYDQECYLIRDIDNVGYLVYPNGSKEEIGTTRELNKADINTCDNYTIIYKKDKASYFTFNK